jgi:hypothetical protein
MSGMAACLFSRQPGIDSNACSAGLCKTRSNILALTKLYGRQREHFAASIGAADGEPELKKNPL